LQIRIVGQFFLQLATNSLTRCEPLLNGVFTISLLYSRGE
jgi:hypothetical protein